MRRAFVIVIDALGVGALPDAPAFNDALTANTLGNIDATVNSLNLPTLASLGAGYLTPMRHVPPIDAPIGRYGKMMEISQGKDTTTGHWEMMGIHLKTPFRTYPDGFPPEVLNAFIAKSGCQGVLGNKPASGTAVIDEYAEEHLKTGYPILYTSADSVFQLACHVDKVPLETLYHWCEAAREVLQGEHEVSRVIARPFTGTTGNYKRLGGDRRDYAVPPPAGSVLDVIKQAGGITLGVGKIEDIFCQSGITHAIHTKNNEHGMQVTQQILENQLDLAPLDIAGKALSDYRQEQQFIFVNLVETDMNYGHRRDVEGYARALEAIDEGLAKFIPAMKPDDLLIITGDHGCDPTAPGNDHTREYAPMLLYSPSVPPAPVGVRTCFADIGKTVLDWLGLEAPEVMGSSMISDVSRTVLQQA